MPGKFSVTVFILLLLLLSCLSCKNNSQFHGYSDLFPNQQINKVIILPFEPKSNFSSQATTYTELYLTRNSSIKIIPHKEMLKTFKADRLTKENLSEKFVMSLRERYQAELILCGEAILHQKYNSFNKDYSYSHDIIIKLIDSKNGYIVGQYDYVKQTGKLEDTIKKLVDKLIDDMRWSTYDEMRDDVFDNTEDNSLLPPDLN